MLGKPVPDFSLQGTGGNFRLNDERGKQLVLYFDPREDFRTGTRRSRAPTRYERKVRGIERSTFVVDEKGCWRANGAG